MTTNAIIGVVLALTSLSALFMLGKKLSFGIRVLIAMGLGLAVGYFFKDAGQYIGFVGSAFVSLIKMLVIPLVITAIISSITSLRDADQLKRLGGKTIGLFLFTAVIASIIGILVGKWFNPGEGFTLSTSSDYQPRELPEVTQVILDFIPSNPVNEMANGLILPVLVFSILIAVAITIELGRNAEKVQPAVDVINAFSTIIFRLTKMIIKLTPYGVFGLLGAMGARYGIETIVPLLKMVLAVYAACLIHLVLTYGSLVTFVGKVNPIRFLKKVFPAMVVAFSTRSSYGTLPVTIKTLTSRVKVSERVSSFVAPIGSTMNMDACGGLYPAIVAIFVGSVTGFEFTFMTYVVLVLTSTLASVGTAGVPGTASIMATVVLASLGLPIEGLALVLAIDPLIDMGRTMVNVTGDTVVALIVGDSEGEFDREAFNNSEDDDLELNDAKAIS